jgi:hypothetical protein
MKNVESVPRLQESKFAVNFVSRAEEPKGYHIRGDVFMELRDATTNALLESREHRNLVVKDASVLIARLIKDSSEVPFGAFCLAVGSGDAGWDLMNPPSPTVTQRSLYGEISRKTFVNTQFIDAGGIPVGYPTHVVDFTTTFSESEAVGPLCEMGLVAGNVSSNLSIRNPVLPPNGPYDATVDLTLYETLLNHLTFPVINKPPTSTLTIVWRLTF